MIILGIDPALNQTGWAVVESNSIECVALGCITTCKKDAMATRLSSLYQAVYAICSQHLPQCIAIEKTFVNTNSSSSIILGQARGAILAACGGLKATQIEEYSPNTIKKAITGNGHASKSSLAFLLTKIVKKFPHQLSLKDDMTDALATAVCCALSQPTSYH
jgi:crossover junction endodeoxyribonuclease RuvC